MQSLAGHGVLIDTLILLDRFLLCATVMTSTLLFTTWSAVVTDASHIALVIVFCLALLAVT